MSLPPRNNLHLPTLFPSSVSIDLTPSIRRLKLLRRWLPSTASRLHLAQPTAIPTPTHHIYNPCQINNTLFCYFTTPMNSPNSHAKSRLPLLYTSGYHGAACPTTTHPTPSFTPRPCVQTKTTRLEYIHTIKHQAPAVSNSSPTVKAITHNTILEHQPPQSKPHPPSTIGGLPPPLPTYTLAISILSPLLCYAAKPLLLNSGHRELPSTPDLIYYPRFGNPNLSLSILLESILIFSA
ncbi:hypothetical protein DCAR_0414465 [Daucus carota subsp. sativus]|uniref:Uncharacterized protein n=1 Tax=Daucus carota subsp. sativus TaxID=79200 RepID=A0A175YCZ6_DAUCS|nr:hypothetical protein DCAR_0414465 [Daucus carota subsp. sativus]